MGEADEMTRLSGAVLCCLVALVCGLTIAESACTIGCDEKGEPCDCPAECWACLVNKAKGAMGDASPTKLKAFSNKVKDTFKAGDCASCKFTHHEKGCSAASVSGIECGTKELKKLLQGKGRKAVPWQTFLKNPAKYGIIKNCQATCSVKNNEKKKKEKKKKEKKSKKRRLLSSAGPDTVPVGVRDLTFQSFDEQVAKAGSATFDELSSFE